MLKFKVTHILRTCRRVTSATLLGQRAICRAQTVASWNRSVLTGSASARARRKTDCYKHTKQSFRATTINVKINAILMITDTEIVKTSTVLITSSKGRSKYFSHYVASSFHCLLSHLRSFSSKLLLYNFRLFSSLQSGMVLEMVFPLAF